ncbi:MAG: endolytic transglycosylase MltG [Candidatus Pacebacteria bacterium]|nr:endolytic transglycosylase MltG [Candidatus Paceibacterota bacterium]
MTTLKKILLPISILVFFAFIFYFSNRELPYKEDLFTIEEGETLKTISQSLKEEGFIKSSNLFYISLYLSNNPKAIKAGVYQLNSEMGNQKIINQIIKGETATEKITIVEGWTISEIASYLENKGLFEKEAFISLANSNEFTNEFEFLKYKPKNINLEGYLFPDTYYVEKNDTPEIIIRKMLSNFENKVWNGINNKENFYNILILASILEKEVTTFYDKQLVTDILLKRLEIGMALQLDATVIYANNLEVFDLEIDSPYNTYKYPGLPIGPISNPGTESIEAALNPIKNNYWYYLSTKDGTTIFSKTFEEHKMNKNIYLR